METPFGTVHCNHSEGYGVKKTKYEYEDIAKIAAEQEMSFESVLRVLPDPQDDAGEGCEDDGEG